MKVIQILAIAGFSTVTVGAYAEDASTMQSVQSAAQQMYYEITGKDSTVINFEKASAILSDAGRNELTALLNAVRDTSPIKEILIVSYSDLDYPQGKKGDLPAKSRQLAKDRAEAVKKRLEELGAKDIQVHNMAEKATWYEKLWVSTDAQVKSEAKEKKSSTDTDDSFYQILGQSLKKSGGPGKVVVVIRHQGTYSH